MKISANVIFFIKQQIDFHLENEMYICGMEQSDFNPSGVGHNNGNFIGLPFSEEEAKVVVLSVPWDVTVSYNDGTSNAPANIMEVSLQLDVEQPGIPDAWKMGIYVRPLDRELKDRNDQLRLQANRYIQFIENGGDVRQSAEMNLILDEINQACSELNRQVYAESQKLIEQDKLPAVLGGEHSCPLGLMQALSEKYGSFGVLQFDAHMDLRAAYEGFHHSHASILYNAISNKHVSKLVQVGIRDYCEEEIQFASNHGVETFFDHELKSNQFKGITWHQQCLNMIENLPDKVYLSFDIDGLNPHLCPTTGTPVPGGLEFAEAMYLIQQVVESGRTIIGFDLCEVGGTNDWDANVGARVLYNICNWAGKSQGWI